MKVELLGSICQSMASPESPHSNVTGSGRIRPRTTWIDESDEFDRQQRQLQCQRASYKGAARLGSVALAAGYIGVAAYTHWNGIPRMQTKSMLLAMICTGGLWVGMERTYLECQMQMAKERASARGLDTVDEDLYV
jgi:hypothetical protein